MANVQLRGITKRFGSHVAVSDVSFDVADGEFVVLVGPSGCGKTTVLRMIAGLEEITNGVLHIDGVLANDLSPAARGIAMVFQSYALYPHMSVYQNMGFGMKLAGVPKTQIDAAVRQAAGVLHIEHLLERAPAELSGGQRQRVAIGRAITRKPKVFLFDEPLSNLDAAMRIRMRVEFSRLHEELGSTMIYVTHDQIEAMTLADRIVVFSAGRVEQVGAPLDLYHRPSNLFVAGFIGSPRMNFLQGQLLSGSSEEASVELSGGAVVSASVDAGHLKPGTPVTVGIRPDEAAIADGEVNRLPVSLRHTEQTGDATVLYADMDGLADAFVVRCPGSFSAERGARLVLSVSKTACHVFDSEGRALSRSLVPQATHSIKN
jgi:multiple sugar transport system ATP-binding protein